MKRYLLMLTAFFMLALILLVSCKNTEGKNGATNESTMASALVSSVTSKNPEITTVTTTQKQTVTEPPVTAEPVFWDDNEMPVKENDFSELYSKAADSLYVLPDVVSYKGSEFVFSVSGNTLLMNEVFQEESRLDDDRRVIIFDISRNEVCYSGIKEAEITVKLLTENSVAVIDGKTGTVCLCDKTLAKKNRIPYKGDSFSGAYECVELSADGEYLLISEYDKNSVSLINIASGESRDVFITDSGYYFSGKAAGCMFFTAYKGVSNVYSLNLITYEVRQCVSLSDCFSLVSGYLNIRQNQNGTTYLSRVTDYKTIIEFPVEKNEGYYSCYSNSVVLYTNYDNTDCYAYDIRNRNAYKTTLPYNGEYIYISYSELSENGFAVFSDSIHIYLWDFTHSDCDKLEAVKTSEDEIRKSIEAEASGLYDKFGISLYYGKDGNDFESNDYLTRTVTDIFTVKKAIEKINATLGVYPEGMVKEMCAGGVKSIDIYLTGKIFRTSDYSIDTAIAFTYTQNDKRVIVFDIADGMYCLSDSIAHELMHIMDDRIEEKENETGIPYLSYWNNFVPPSGQGYYFTYNDKYGSVISDSKNTMVYETNQKKIWFVDAYSKTFPTEDRARIMEHLVACALGDDGSALKGENLLMKARYLCVVIRACFETVDDNQAQPWEASLGTIDMNEFSSFLTKRAS